MNLIIRVLLIAVLGVACALASVRAGSAQTTRVVEGRVVNPDGVGIPNATVALEGIGFRLTDDDGDFRFGAVSPRAYTLHVEGLGYQAVSLNLVVEDDVTTTVTLQVSPLLLDSLVVDSRSIDIEVRVWDPVKDLPVQSAEVVSDQADPTRTSWGGRFKIRVADGVPVRIQVRAFRYLPLDTLVVPEEGTEYRFELVTDPVVARMLEMEIVRLDDRMGGRRAVGMGPFNRDDLARWSGASLFDLLRARFPNRGRRLQCIVLDERDVGAPMVVPTLKTTFADQVDRIEFLFRGAMLRVYTKDFMRKMIGGGIELRRPTYVDIVKPVYCH